MGTAVGEDLGGSIASVITGEELTVDVEVDMGGVGIVGVAAGGLGAGVQLVRSKILSRKMLR
jgi:hypothetical protein